MQLQTGHGTSVTLSVKIYFLNKLSQKIYIFIYLFIFAKALSSFKNTKHVDFFFFFLNDRIKKDHIFLPFSGLETDNTFKTGHFHLFGVCMKM